MLFSDFICRYCKTQTPFEDFICRNCEREMLFWNRKTQTPFGDLICWNCKTQFGDFICSNCKIKSHKWTSKCSSYFSPFHFLSFSFAFAELLLLSCIAEEAQTPAPRGLQWMLADLIFQCRSKKQMTVGSKCFDVHTVFCDLEILILGRMAIANGTYVFIAVDLFRKLISNSNLTFFRSQ